MKVLFTLLLLCFSLFATGNSMESEIVRLINQYRAQKNLPALQTNGAIAAAAQKHSNNMAAGRVGFGHGGFDNRIDKLLHGIKGAYSGAENVAYGSRTAEDVVKLWINSAGHRKNIKGKYNLTGVGIARSRKGTLYFTQIFIATR
jgi:uncharacterized protein YkwD